ncbi:MAG: SDR family oxidoreductase [Bacillota bacterium]|nr:SDR family oxidoreductase [Bacillota bacterium]
MYIIKNQTYSLITGASSGIGKEIAESLAKRGNNLILISRRRNILEQIAKYVIETYNVKVLTMPCDLTEKDSPKSIYLWCKENNIIVDTIINNAGMGLFGEFFKQDIEKQMSLIELNINCLVKLTYYFLPDLLKLSKGYILNVASIAALYPLPYYCVYGATKAFVLSFTEALRFEMRDSNVTISCLCPGDTDTDFFVNAGNVKKKKPTQPPSIVADTAVRLLMKNEPVIFPANANMMSKIPRRILKKMVFKRISSYKV